MAPEEPVSAVVVRVPVPPGIARLRGRWDWAASVGVPAHVTVLFPFLPASHLVPAVRRELATIAAAQPAFEVTFATVARFPGVVYLAPDPAEPFVRLTGAVAARFPAFPPYAGAFAEVVPHLTVVEREDAPLDAIAEDATGSLPFGCRVTALEVLVESAGRWRRRWRIPLAIPPEARP